MRWQPDLEVVVIILFGFIESTGGDEYVHIPHRMVAAAIFPQLWRCGMKPILLNWLDYLLEFQRIVN